MAQFIACGTAKPVKATGAPISLGWINHQGDPAGSFPDFTAGAHAAVDYINNVLGGVGGNIAKGVAGRPISLTDCFMKVTPADAVSCANQEAAQKHLAVIQGYDFFSESAFPTLLQSGTAVFNQGIITVADFTTKGTYALASGAGCVGVHPALIDFAVNTLHAKRVMVPWDNTAPGVVCYYDLEKKPLDVLEGKLQVPGVTPVAGLTDGAVSIPPNAADDSGPASQVLAFKPDAIIWSGAAPDCFALFNSLVGQGWSASKIPLIFSSACVDPTQFKQAGSALTGVYFVGAPDADVPSAYQGITRTEMETYQTELKKYGAGQASTALSASGFQGVMTVFQMITDDAAKVGGIDSVTSANLSDFAAKTTNYHEWAASPLGCADATPPYLAICNPLASVSQWTGSSFKVIIPSVNGTKLITGLPIKTGP